MQQQFDESKQSKHQNTLEQKSKSSQMGKTTNSKFLTSSDMTDGFFLSASVLRQSSPKISFTKADRFPMLKTNESSSLLNLPSQQDNRSTHFGYGNKQLMPDYVLKNAKQLPPPNIYNTQKNISNQKKGKSFGLSFMHYAKNYLEHIPLYVAPEIAAEIPGPGKYEVIQEIGKNKLKYTISSRFKKLSSEYTGPSASLYHPVDTLTKPSRYLKITQGFGKKYDFTTTKQGPGPGTYALYSVFDKFDKQKQQQKQKRMERLIKSTSAYQLI